MCQCLVANDQKSWTSLTDPSWPIETLAFPRGCATMRRNSLRIVNHTISEKQDIDCLLCKGREFPAGWRCRKTQAESKDGDKGCRMYCWCSWKMMHSVWRELLSRSEKIIGVIQNTLKNMVLLLSRLNKVMISFVNRRLWWGGVVTWHQTIKPKLWTSLIFYVQWVLCKGNGHFIIVLWW